MAQEKMTNLIWRSGMRFDGVDGKGRVVPIDDGPDGSSPMDLLLISLAGCTAMDIIMILEKKRQDVDSFVVVTRGERAETYPRKYTKIRLEYVLRGKQITEDAVISAIKLSEEKYCSVMGTLDPEVKITTCYRIEA